MFFLVHVGLGFCLWTGTTGLDNCKVELSIQLPLKVSAPSVPLLNTCWLTKGEERESKHWLAEREELQHETFYPVYLLWDLCQKGKKKKEGEIGKNAKEKHSEEKKSLQIERWKEVQISTGTI